MTSPEPDPLVGRVLDDRYAVLEKLGEGGMGAVYEAEQVALARRVAVKIIHPMFAGNGEIRARFAREATASGQLDGHPHVATAIDFGTLPDGSLYLVMQLVKGPSLRDVVDAGPMPPARVARLGAQIADALSAAHAKGIVHRDLKPDNVALVRREDGREVAKVLDFGIARMVDAEAPIAATGATAAPLTRVGTVMGTPGYMAPEQAVGDRVDERADLYAFGAMLYEMLVGVVPFDGPDYAAILALQFTEEPKPPSAARPDAGIAPDLDALVVELLQREPQKRLGTAAAARARLEALVHADEGRLSSVTVAPVPSASAASADVTGTAGPAAPAPGPRAALARLEAALPARLRPHAKAVVGAAAVMLLGLGLALGSGGSSPAPGEAPSAHAPSGLAAIVRGDGLPDDVEAQLEALTGDDRAARTAARDALAARTDLAELPPVVGQLVAFDAARSCRARKDVVVALGALGDARALPALERLAAEPKRGCGFLDSRDCHACLRRELDAAITALGGTP